MSFRWFPWAIAGLLVCCAAATAQGPAAFRLLSIDGNLVRWGERGTSPTVTYAVIGRPESFPHARNCGELAPLDHLLARSGLTRARFMEEVREAFDMWERAANIRFVETADPSAAAILIGAQVDPEGRAFTDVAYRPGSQNPRRIERSLICLNPEKRWKMGSDGNVGIYDIRYTIAHEVGHAIGLDHPETHGQLMSLRYQEQFRTLQEGDITGAVELYGLPNAR
jgi:hypothetical protein